MPNVATLINKINFKELKNNLRTEPPKGNCNDKINCPFQAKCQFECLVYKVEIHSHGLNNNNVSKND